MTTYIMKRVLLMFITLWFIITLTFFALLLVPGRPYPNYDKMDDAQLAMTDHQAGFDRNPIVQYLDYLTGVMGMEGAITYACGAPESYDDMMAREAARAEMSFFERIAEGFEYYQAHNCKDEPDYKFFGFDFGYSYTKQDDVIDILIDRYPVSLKLGLSALLVGTLIGLALGLVAAINKNTKYDYTATIIAVIGLSFPSFVIASYLQLFASNTGLFAVQYERGSLSSMILPIISLSFFAIAQVARVTRTEMVEILESNYINLARAKGVSNKNVVIKHAFRNSLVTILTIMGPLTVALTTGSLVVESIYAIPGIGDILVTSVLTKDTFLVLGTVIFISIQILIVYLIVDIGYGFVDPRIKVGGKDD